MKLMPIDRKVLTENKLIKMIQELGENFKNFLLVNSTVDIALILQKATNGVIAVNQFINLYSLLLTIFQIFIFK